MPDEKTESSVLRPGETPEQSDVEKAASHYFDKGRCSNHAQYNGRYCRDAGPWERWCIHCAGFMLLDQLTHERTLRQQIAQARDAWKEQAGASRRIAVHEAKEGARFADEAEAKLARVTEALRSLSAKWRNEAAHKDTFHATMGIGWKVCADELEALLPQPSDDSNEDRRRTDVMARSCGACSQLIAQPNDEYIELQVRVMDATKSETQDPEDQSYGDFCDPCIRSGAALSLLLAGVGWKLEASSVQPSDDRSRPSAAEIERPCRVCGAKDHPAIQHGDRDRRREL